MYSTALYVRLPYKIQSQVYGKLLIGSSQSDSQLSSCATQDCLPWNTPFRFPFIHSWSLALHLTSLECRFLTAPYAPAGRMVLSFICWLVPAVYSQFAVEALSSQLQRTRASRPHISQSVHNCTLPEITTLKREKFKYLYLDRIAPVRQG
jgi:hypothetical protein